MQGYVTADLVDYVLDARKEHVTAVYHLLGTDTVDLVGYRDLYKDAVTQAVSFLPPWLSMWMDKCQMGFGNEAFFRLPLLPPQTTH